MDAKIEAIETEEAFAENNPTTCAVLLRKRYQRLKHLEFEADSEAALYKEWLGNQTRHISYIEQKEASKAAIRALKLEMDRLAGMPDQVDLNFDV